MFFDSLSSNEPRREKKNGSLLGFRPGPTHSGMYIHRRRLEAWRQRLLNAKTKALISCAVTAQLISGFVFANAKIHLRKSSYLETRLKGC